MTVGTIGVRIIDLQSNLTYILQSNSFVYRIEFNILYTETNVNKVHL